MPCEEVKELIQLRALDLLDLREQDVVREHLQSGCPRCAAEAAAISETVSLLPFALPQEEPSPMAKARLMAAVSREVAAASSTVVRPVWRVAVAASIVAALAGAALSGFVMMRRQEQLVAEVASLKLQVSEARQSIRLLTSPGVEVVELTGQGERAGQAVRLFWDRAGQSWQLYASNLPPAPAGKVYQLWVITEDGQKISAGTFDTAMMTAAAGSLNVPSGAGRATLAAVTLEPTGGSAQPTTRPFLVGSL